MTNSFKEPELKRTNVFFFDEKRLAAFSEVQQRLLDDETSAALELARSRDIANELAGIIESHRADAITSPRAPEILQLELDEAQVGTLSLARHLTRHEPIQTQGSAALLK